MEPPDDGRKWHPHNSGPMPVAFNRLLWVCYVDGAVNKSGYLAQAYRWWYTGNRGTDIAFYTLEPPNGGFVRGGIDYIDMMILARGEDAPA